MRRILQLGCVAAAAMAWFPAVTGGQTVTVQSLLSELTDRDRLAKFPNPAYTGKQFSSYDRASTSPDKADTWFANGDAGKYIRVDKNDKIEGGEEFVMMEAEGPGAIVRIWSANPSGTIYFYVDGATTPTLAVPMADLLGGRWKIGAPLSETVSKGWNLYYPIPYAKSIKVTCAGNRIKNREGNEYNESLHLYYHINYRTYAAGTPVESFSTAVFDGATEKLAQVQDALTKPESEAQDPSPISRATYQLQPGEKRTLDLPPGPGAVRYLAMGLQVTDQSPTVRAQGLRNVVLTMEFDGEETVWCPMSDFFGSGVGHNVYKDWFRSMLMSNFLHARWIMPYKTSGKISVTNTGTTPWTVRVNAATKEYPKWDDSYMHFHCRWKYEYPIHAKGGAGTVDWNFVEVQGKGVFVGDALSVMNPVNEWWGEGDEKIYVDGESFPSHFGTGTEDYYGYAWCCPDTFTSAFHAQPRSDGQQGKNNRGYVTNTRVRTLDAIPFTKSFKFDMEVWHWRESDVNYAGATYFYAFPGATTNIKPQPEATAQALLQVPPPPPVHRIEGAIECETMKVAAKSEGVEVGPQGGFGPKTWSNETHLWIQAKKVGDYVEIEIPAPDNKPVNAVIYATKSWDYGIVRFSVDGKQVGPVSDLYNEKDRQVVSTGPLELGTLTPKDGKIVLRAEVIGANPKSEGTRAFFGLDCVVLKPAP